VKITEHPLLAAAGLIGGTLAVGYQRQSPGMTFDWRDYAMFVVFGLLLYWLLKPSKTSE
jgi:hypothetical protein